MPFSPLSTFTHVKKYASKHPAKMTLYHPCISFYLKLQAASCADPYVLIRQQAATLSFIFSLGIVGIILTVFIYIPLSSNVRQSNPINILQKKRRESIILSRQSIFQQQSCAPAYIKRFDVAAELWSLHELKSGTHPLFCCHHR